MMKFAWITLLALVLGTSSTLAQSADPPQDEPAAPAADGAATHPEANPADAPADQPGADADKEKKEKTIDDMEVAVFGAGCFWCTEAVFEQLKGVKRVVSGYSGGNVPYPTYHDVCTGLTGHAESVHILFDPDEISYTELLEVFWKTHDPTTPNQQGIDVGTQYRSVIFYTNAKQRDLALYYKNRLNASGAFFSPVVTEVAPFEAFFPAEMYHQDYFRRNRSADYCQMWIVPKVQKFRKVFKDKLRKAPARPVRSSNKGHGDPSKAG